MDLDLEKWQTLLDKHFSELYSQRHKASGRAVFALEHGLERKECDSLKTAVRTHIANHSPSSKHWLAWVVYATEIGYLYSGDEYWQTFEDETPGWRTYGDRYCIRRYYRLFHDRFGGAKPSGAWAEHFSIICWPITHAILPQDLQRQLARILYELRHLFNADLFESPKLLGEAISARSWSATSRFQNFAEEEELVGQIAAALLLEGKVGSESLILPSTLTRIRADLDRERRSREWLRKARSMARERASVRGLGFGGGRPVSGRERERARIEVAQLGIEPRLVLRPKETSESLWEVTLEIPDLSHVGLRFPKARPILSGSRLVVAGAAGRPLARGRCLHGSQRVILGRWPKPAEVLLQFEEKYPQLDYLLSTECLVRPGPTWLFRVASDGLAYECRSLRVRPNQRYILVRSTESAVSLDGYAGKTALECEGVQAVSLDIPDSLDEAWEEVLRKLGLSQAKSIEVWPAGLAAVVWDGEGHGEWLAAERPTLAVRSDHSVGTLRVSMGIDESDTLELNSLEPGETAFVELPHLPVGLHTVQFSTLRDGAITSEPLGELDVVIRIREGRPWSPGVSPHGPLQVALDPPNPTLEEIWEGHVDIAVRGPVGRRVKSRVALFEKNGNAPIFKERLSPLSLPITPNDWQQHFDRHFRSKQAVQNVYDAARICEIEFDAEELGAFAIRGEREFVPLRWVVKRSGASRLVHLHNDSGQEEEPKVTFATFEDPTNHTALEPRSEYEVPASGGLYCAQLGDITAAIIGPPTVSGLQDLCCTPRFVRAQRAPRPILDAFESARLWGRGKLTGDVFSAKRKSDVLEAITAYVVALIGGENWERAETYAREHDGDLSRLQSAISRRSEETAIGVIIARDCRGLKELGCSERVAWFASLLARYLSLPKADTPEAGPESTQWICELALRISSQIEGVGQWAGTFSEAGVKRLLEELPTLVRAARFCVFATAKGPDAQSAFVGHGADWRWP